MGKILILKNVLITFYIYQGCIMNFYICEITLFLIENITLIEEKHKHKNDMERCKYIY